MELTQFGFTPTESVVYGALVNRGPSNGYALAKVLDIARANAYQALAGLAAKGAALIISERPQRYRAIRPDVLFALITERQSQKLDALEAQLTRPPETATDVLLPIRGDRALLQLATRSAVRGRGSVNCVAPGRMLQSLLPAWRQRAGREVETLLWSVGDIPDFPLPLQGTVESLRIERLFNSPAMIFLTPESTILARLLPSGTQGYWSSDPVLLGATQAALAPLTTP